MIEARKHDSIFRAFSSVRQEKPCKRSLRPKHGINVCKKRKINIVLPIKISEKGRAES